MTDGGTLFHDRLSGLSRLSTVSIRRISKSEVGG